MQPKVHVYAAVDAGGESYERLRAAGLDVQVPEEPWSQAANRSGDSVELIFHPSTVAGAGVANRLNVLTRRSLESAPRAPPDRQVFRGLRQCRRGGGHGSRHPRRQQPEPRAIGAASPKGRLPSCSRCSRRCASATGA